MADAPKKRKRVTIRTLNKKMREGEQIVQMAIYDYRSAVIADRQDIDILCVSDTGGMILFGHKSTVTVTFDEVMMMAKAIDRGSQYGMRMVDMPYWSFHVSAEQAVENAGRFVHEANAEVMKCEGNLHHARNIEAIIKAGIPVQGHIGITPMRIPQMGGFFAQGKTADAAKRMVDDAQAFAARVVGDSMLPEYAEGDIVVFSPAAEVTDGCDCFVRIEPDHETTFKRVFFDDDGQVRLQPLNPRFAPQLFDRLHIAGMYRAVKKIQSLI